MKAFTFEVASCVPSLNPQCTFMVILTTVLLYFICHLFPLVAIRVLNFPLCCCSLPCTPSLLFRQRAAALPSSFHFIDPPALFFVLPCFLHSHKTSKSLLYVLPCLSNLKPTILLFGSFDFMIHICSFSFF
jgi:hypothetical protein